ncbi:MAG: glycosyltransferase family 2 protein [Candidatus Levybacteria bacterium]|nr:glycosyltransferase family 2 protein [Candidatus Levybacteria bacterium]
MGRQKPTVDIVIPAFNEETIISATISECLRLPRYTVRVLVVVDGKTVDKTASKAKKAGATVIRTREKGGKGAIFRHSFSYLRSDYVIQIDADHQFQPKEITKLVEPLRHGIDVTLGTRYQQGSMVEMYSVSFLKLFGSFFLSFMTSLFASQKITDVMAGFKGFRKDVLLSLSPRTNHFGYEAELVITAAKRKYKILNVPITYTARPTGSSSVSSMKHGFLVLSTIIKTGLKRR